MGGIGAAALAGKKTLGYDVDWIYLSLNLSCDNVGHVYARTNSNLERLQPY